jgi:hypothetical protein
MRRMNGMVFFQELTACQGQGHQKDQAEDQGFEEQPINEESEAGKEESCNAYAYKSIMDKVLCYGMAARHGTSLFASKVLFPNYPDRRIHGQSGNNFKKNHFH